MLKSLTKSIGIKCTIRNFSNNWNNLIQITDEVLDCLSQKKAMVALESTVITHGMPWPTNFETAMELEKIIRDEGVTPVTIGVMNGKINAGFSKPEMEELAKSINSLFKPVKISRQNLYSCRHIKYGGTTVSGTMVIADKLGIKIFATGGVGGVHREVKHTMDISTDLKELGRTPVCVISSGIKSFLDIPKTLEYLETEGVFVCTLNSEVFPNFFTRSSGIKSPNNIESIEQVATIIHDMINLKLNSGVLIAVPITDDLEKDGHLIQQAIIKSLENAKSAHIVGSHITPYVLNQINFITQGRSLTLNVELIKNNAHQAAKLARELQKLRENENESGILIRLRNKSSIAVIGGTIVDISTVIKDKSVVNLETITPCGAYDCESTKSCGGVGRNLAEVFSRLDEECHFLSVLGSDYYGNFILKNSNAVDLSKVKFTADFETANCSIISCQNREILFHTGNFAIFQCLTPDYIQNYLPDLRDQVKLICLDCNLPEETIESVIKFSKTNGIKIFFEPTDILLVKKPLKVVDRLKELKYPIDIISPNIWEFFQMINYITESNDLDFDFNINLQKSDLLASFNSIKTIMKSSNLLDFIPIWIVKLGPAGVVFASKEKIFFIKQSMFFIPRRQIIKTSGAGDCLISCALLLHFQHNLSWEDSITGSMRIVKESLKSIDTIPKTIDAKNYCKTEIQQWNMESFDRKLLFYRE